MTPARAADLQAAVGIAAGTFPERLAATGPAARALYGALLPAFAANGTPPPVAEAAGRAGLSPEAARVSLADLADADLVALGTDGAVVGAFPLSAVTTRHRVLVDGGPVLHAMCAVGALGMPAMLGRAARVVSADPDTGQPIEVRVEVNGSPVADPRSAVVLLARVGGRAARVGLLLRHRLPHGPGGGRAGAPGRRGAGNGADGPRGARPRRPSVRGAASRSLRAMTPRRRDAETPVL